MKLPVKNSGDIPYATEWNAITAAAMASFQIDKRIQIIEAHPSDHDKVVIKGSNHLPLQVGPNFFFIDEDVNISTASDLDTGTVSNGKQYYVYACDNSGTLIFKISLNSTYPSGYTADNSRKIGGFHTLCSNVGTITGHALTGYIANDILPASIWDLKHRPVCEPSGMVYDEALHMWVDIYLASGTGTNTASVYGATISDTRDWINFVDDGHAVKKRLPTDEEFQSLAAGSNEETNIAGSADPVTTGGHSDTASRRMTSDIGCEDTCGTMNQWLQDQSYRYNGEAWTWYDLPSAKGSFYKQGTYGDIKLLAGLSWIDATNCGSQGRYASFNRWRTDATLTTRFLAKPL